MTRIVLDCRFAASHSGIGRFIRELAPALLERREPWQYALLVHKTSESWIPKGAEAIAFPVAHYSWREHVSLPPLLKRANTELFFSPHFNVPFRLPIPFVCTVHDLILHRFPNRAPPWKRLAYRLLLRNAVRRARTVVTVSEATRTELHDVYDLPDTRTAVVSPGVSPTLAPVSSEEATNVSVRYGIRPGFLLYVGNAKEHKQVPLLLRAFSRLPSSARLVLVTGGPEAHALAVPPRVTLLPSVPDRDLAALYTAASGCVSASAAEGFGLPFLEAFACGCPVAAFSVGSIPEVTAGLAHLSDPTEEGLARNMEHLVRNPPDEAARERLRVHAARFTWSRAAERLAGVFRAALGGVY